jgi:hypothetical protein
MKESSRQTAQRTRNAKTQKRAFVYVAPNQSKAKCRSDKVGNRHSRYRELCSHMYCQQRSQNAANSEASNRGNATRDYRRDSDKCVEHHLLFRLSATVLRFTIE